MKRKINNAVLAAFTADALSLGVHWVYDTSQIRQKYGRLDKMVAPQLAEYHLPKQAGEFTHYGDQMMVLLESVSTMQGFDLRDFSRRWQDLFESYNGYVDHASKETLGNLKAGKSIDTAGSGSADLAGAARIPALFAAGIDDEQNVIAAARQQTAMTHNHADVVDASEWMARTAIMIFNGLTPTKAMTESLDAMPDAALLHRSIASGMNSKSEDTQKAIGDFGQMCSIHAALPSAVHLVAKYEDNFEDAMVENIMAGGDSSARGEMVGFLIGAKQADDFFPKSWLADMAASPRINTLLAG